MGKHLCWSLFLIKLKVYIETEPCKVFSNIFVEHLQRLLHSAYTPFLESKETEAVVRKEAPLNVFDNFLNTPLIKKKVFQEQGCIKFYFFRILRSAVLQNQILYKRRI